MSAYLDSNGLVRMLESVKAATIDDLSPAQITGIYIAPDEDTAQIYSGANPTVLVLYKEG